MPRPKSSCGLAVPPGFKPLSKGNSPSNTATEVGGRISRKRNKPHMFDPSPPVPVPPTPKRGRPPATHKGSKGRPLGSGRKQKPPLLAQGELRIEKEPRVSAESLSRGNNQLTPLQFGNQVIHVNTSPVILQSRQHNQNMKREHEDVTVDDQPRTTCAREIQETTNCAPLQESQTMVSAPQYGHERDGNNQLNGTSESYGGTSQLGSSTLAPILHAIIKKHGDIVKDCPLKSSYMRSSLLEGICKVVHELRRMEPTELDSSHLCAYYSAMKDAQMMKLDVKWLERGLDEIQQVVRSNVEAKKLTEIKTRRMEQIEVMKKEVQNLKSEIEAKECQLAVETRELEKLNNTIRGMTSLPQRFQGKSLLDGLL